MKARYQRVCRGCGAYTRPCSGKGSLWVLQGHPGATEPNRSRQLMTEPMDAASRQGWPPSSSDSSAPGGLLSSHESEAIHPFRSRRRRATWSTASRAPLWVTRRQSTSNGSVTGGSTGRNTEPSRSWAKAVRT